MEVLLYEPVLNDKSKKLLHGLVENIELGSSLEVHRSIHSLSHILSQPTGRPDIAVLLTATRKDLKDILSIKDLLTGIRTVLLLPDKKGDTIAQGHRLNPRFVGFPDDDAEEVVAVLRKMLGYD